jgi:hypothetical protein
MSHLQPDQPFWKDEPHAQLVSTLPSGFIRFIIVTFKIQYYVVFVGLSIAVFSFLKPVVGLFWLGILAVSMGLGFYRRKQKKLEIQEITQIQQYAREFSGASLIGSAVHVAGHPSLEREQNVVLALTGSNLKIYSYETDQPLVTIPIQEISAIQTVVYDDERVPHIDVVDSAAQAIQVTLKYGERDVASLFHKMKRVRPIDWYHAIQKSRVA